jgi:HK97 gp10 family phage protein
VKLRVEGLKELEQAMMGMKAATAKGVARRVLLKRAEIFAEDMRPRVRVDQGELRDSIGVGTKLTTRQRRLHRKGSDVEVFAGAGGLTQAITEEFGTTDQAAHPAARPAWEATKMKMLDGLKDDLAAEIEKTAKRVRRRG